MVEHSPVYCVRNYIIGVNPRNKLASEYSVKIVTQFRGNAEAEWWLVTPQCLTLIICAKQPKSLPVHPLYGSQRIFR